MDKRSRLTPLPTTPALVRRTVTIAAVTTAAGILGCADPAPVNYPPQRPQDFDPDRKVHPEAPPPEAPQADPPQIVTPQPPPQSPPQVPNRQQVIGPPVLAPQVADTPAIDPQVRMPDGWRPQDIPPPGPPPQIPYRPTDGQIFKKN